MTTDDPARVVWAVDVTASVVSLARFVDTGDATHAEPALGRAAQSWTTNSHTPRNQWTRTEKLADEVAEKIIGGGGGVPTLVVIAKQKWGPNAGRVTPGATRAAIPADPTAQRRMMLQYAIESRLHVAGVPVAEFPYPTALRFMDAVSNGTGRAQMAALADAVLREWGIEHPREDDGKLIAFRPQVVAIAAVGAMAVGLSTSLSVTEQRLDVVRGAGNQAVQFPRNRRCPATVADWQKLHDKPVLLTIGEG